MIEKTSSDLKKEEKLKVKLRKKSTLATSGNVPFEKTLDVSIQFDFQGSLDELMTDLNDQERHFLEKQNLYELNRYKAIVQKILKLVMQEGFRTITLKRNRRDKSDFTVVEEINSRLMDITAAITHNNKAFNLLKTIEEIRGLILDLQF